MKSRYEEVRQKTNDKGKLVYTSVTLPYIEPREDDIYVVTNVTDRLDMLSYKYYQTPRYWWVLAMVNNIGAGTMFVPAGTKLRIPVSIGNILSLVRETNL